MIKDREIQADVVDMLDQIKVLLAAVRESVAEESGESDADDK